MENIFDESFDEALVQLNAAIPQTDSSSVVPKNKMDMASSAMKGAIEYIKELHEIEKGIESEISDLELGISNKKGLNQQSFPLEVLDLNVHCTGEKRMVVSFTCNKRKDTIAKLCRLTDSLGINIITTTTTTIGKTKVLKTLFIEVAEGEKEEIKRKIESAIAVAN